MSKSPISWATLLLAAVLLLAGCTPTSTKLAKDGSERSDNVMGFVTAAQHRSLKILLFRETLAKLHTATTDAERQAILNAAWNDRDLFEFWAAQTLLARALHYATVDAKLESSRGIGSLLAEDLAKQSQGVVQAADEYVAAKVGAAIAPQPP